MMQTPIDIVIDANNDWRYRIRGADEWMTIDELRDLHNRLHAMLVIIVGSA